MRRTTTILGSTLALTVGVLAGPTSAAGTPGGPHQAPGPPPHPHMLLIHPEVGMVDGGPALVGFRRCVDLAAGDPVPNHAHHAHLHDRAGAANRALTGAGHAVVPGSPLTGWTSCADLADDLPYPLR
jgi:hypothetical protein